MLSLKTTLSIQHVVDNHPESSLRSLLSLRTTQLGGTDGGDLGDLVQFIVFKAGDDINALETELGFTPLQNQVDGTSYGDPDFTPSWEWIEHHDGWIELAYIFSDDGSGVITFVQRADGVEPDLSALCNEWGDDTSTF